MKWIIEAASKRNEKSMKEKLASEMTDAMSILVGGKKTDYVAYELDPVLFKSQVAEKVAAVQLNFNPRIMKAGPIIRNINDISSDRIDCKEAVFIKKLFQKMAFPGSICIKLISM